MHIHLCF
jgi:hypothetical protein